MNFLILSQRDISPQSSWKATQIRINFDHVAYYKKSSNGGTEIGFVNAGIVSGYEHVCETPEVIDSLLAGKEVK